MLQAALVLFVITAGFGIYLLNTLLSKKTAPKMAAVIAHGLFAAVALGLLVTFYIMGHPEPLLRTNIILFALVALGGASLLIMGLLRKPLPPAVTLLHPIFALLALGLLIYQVFWGS